MAIELTINGRKQRFEGDEKRSLLEVLREDLGLTGTKYGCGQGDCRACTVLVDGEPMVSCLTSMDEVGGSEIETIEGLAKDGELHPVQRAFLEAGAMQCGYCVPGMILRTVGLLAKNPKPSEEEIVSALDGNLCRCAGYVRILEAVRIASGRKEAKR